jgi:hypothetical protein
MRGPTGGSKAENNENGDNTLDIQATMGPTSGSGWITRRLAPSTARGEVLVDLTEMGQDEPSEDLFAAPSRVHQTLDQRGKDLRLVRGGQLGTHGIETKPKGLDLLAVNRRRGDKWMVTARLQLERDRHIGVHIAQRSEGREHDAFRGSLVAHGDTL